jgi:hypothetical protein
VSVYNIFLFLSGFVFAMASEQASQYPADFYANQDIQPNHILHNFPAEMVR